MPAGAVRPADCCCTHAPPPASPCPGPSGAWSCAAPTPPSASFPTPPAPGSWWTTAETAPPACCASAQRFTSEWLGGRRRAGGQAGRRAGGQLGRQAGRWRMPAAAAAAAWYTCLLAFLHPWHKLPKAHPPALACRCCCRLGTAGRPAGWMLIWIPTFQSAGALCPARWKVRQRAGWAPGREAGGQAGRQLCGTSE